MPRASRIRGGQKWENRFIYDQVSENADEAEWQAILNGSAHVSVGTMDEAMADAGDELAPASAETLAGDRLQGQEVLQESRQGTVFELIIERKKLLGEAYPFRIDGNTLIHSPGRLPLYELLVGICQAPSLTKAPYCELPRLFEQISMLAGRGYLGPYADGYRTGWPRPEKLSHFKSAIADLKEKSGNYPSEWQWSVAEHLPDDPAPKFIKEDGLDIVVWRKWPDKRTGQLYLMGQCACGADWLKKDKDLDPDSFTDWFKLPRNRPVRSFFTPRYAIDPIINELSKTAGLVFDRIRIIQSLNEPHIAPEIDAISVSIQSALVIARTPLNA